jgi:hypothetical protein
MNFLEDESLRRLNAPERSLEVRTIMMRGKQGRRLAGCCVALGILWMAGARSTAATPRPCAKMALTGEVSAGQEWKAAIGQGWVFRVLPIQPGKAGYSGWDLVVDREQAAGYPDALLLATPPYNSINEREVGTTFGLRAQDAIGWNPRSFRFLTDAAAFSEGQKLYLSLNGVANGQNGVKGQNTAAMRKLMELEGRSSAGQFRILDARLRPGIADAAPYAENWALQSAKTPHTLASAPGGRATPLGELDWIRFSITLWLPAGWKAPRGLSVSRAACSE